MANFRIFLVEDDPLFGELIKHYLSLNPDYEIHLFRCAKDCLNNLHLRPHFVSIDFGLPDLTGDLLLKKIKEINKNIPVIIISGQEDVAIAVTLLKNGAEDYITKDCNTKEKLWNSILKIRENANLKQEVEDLKEQLEQKYSFEKSLIGQSELLKKTFILIEKAIKSNINVSIIGETGTGKEVVAKAIHYNSDRKKKPFIAINMAAIPQDLLESELFGHEKGAFTGAQSRKIGKFEEADGGTIFLDEIAELNLNLQTKLLRVLQEREVTRIGSNERIKFDARLITATHKNLTEEVKAGNFREDLFYRIIGLPIELPALRYRDNDALILAKHFISEYTKENKFNSLHLTNAAKEKILKYNYPGNIRELKAAIDLACVMSNGKEITENDIQFTRVERNSMISTEEKTLREYTNDIIIFFLKKYNQDVQEVASRLDIGKSTIYSLLQRRDGKIGACK